MRNPMGENETFGRMKGTSRCSKKADFRYVFAVQYLKKSNVCNL